MELADHVTADKRSQELKVIAKCLIDGAVSKGGPVLYAACSALTVERWWLTERCRLALAASPQCLMHLKASIRTSLPRFRAGWTAREPA